MVEVEFVSVSRVFGVLVRVILCVLVFVNEVARLPDGGIDAAVRRGRRLSAVLPLHPLSSIKPLSSHGGLMLHL